MFKFKKQPKDALIYVKGFLKNGMRLRYERARRDGKEVYNLHLSYREETSVSGWKIFWDLNHGGSWTEDYLIDRLLDGSCKITDYGKTI